MKHKTLKKRIITYWQAGKPASRQTNFRLPVAFFVLLFTVCCSLFIVSSPVFADTETYILPHCGTGSELIGSEHYDLNSFLWLLVFILRWIFSITGSLAVLMFVYGGYLWLLSAGQEQRVKEGTTTMTNAVIGVAIVLGSWLGVNMIVASLTGMTINKQTPTAMLSFVGTSIAWNQVGQHCIPGVNDVWNFGKLAASPAPPASGASGGAGGGGAPAAPGGGGAPPALPPNTGGQTQTQPGISPTVQPPLVSDQANCFYAIREEDQKFIWGIPGIGALTGEHWEKDKNKNPNPSYSCRMLGSKTWSECQQVTTLQQLGIPQELKTSSDDNKTVYSLGSQKMFCSEGCPPVDQTNGNFNISGRPDCTSSPSSSRLEHVQQPGGAN